MAESPPLFTRYYHYLIDEGLEGPNQPPLPPRLKERGCSSYKPCFCDSELYAAGHCQWCADPKETHG